MGEGGGCAPGAPPPGRPAVGSPLRVREPRNQGSQAFADTRQGPSCARVPAPNSWAGGHELSPTGGPRGPPPRGPRPSSPRVTLPCGTIWPCSTVGFCPESQPRLTKAAGHSGRQCSSCFPNSYPIPVLGEPPPPLAVVSTCYRCSLTHPKRLLSSVLGLLPPGAGFLVRLWQAGLCELRVVLEAFLAHSCSLFTLPSHWPNRLRGSISGWTWRRPLVPSRTKRAVVGVEGTRQRGGQEACLVLIFLQQCPAPCSGLLWPPPALDSPSGWPGPRLVWLGPASSWVPYPPLLRWGRHPLGAAGGSSTPVGGLARMGAQLGKHRGKGSHGWSAKGLSWAEALPLPGPHFGCWFLETRSPGIA